MDTLPAFDVAVVGVGVGMGAGPHLRSLEDLRADYPLTWVCARDAQRLATVELPVGARRTTRLDDILQDPRVRAVLVLTPPSSHLEVVRQVAAAGKHVLVEKPLALDLARARELVACCDATGVALAVMLQYRMREGALRLARLLRSGALGDLTGASAHVRQWRCPATLHNIRIPIASNSIHPFTARRITMATQQQHDNFIDGQWVAGDTYSPNVNPSNTADVLGHYTQASAGQMDQAVQAARAAFAAWSTAGIQARSDALDKIGNEILARREELGTLLAREEGKTRAEGIGEAARAGNIFKFFAGECLRLAGETLASVRPGIGVEVTREPLGVIGLITPWNFPIAIPAWKVAPALAYGNCVVLKPADLVPGCAWALADIISRSGIPAGVFNLVMGRSSVVGDVLVNHAGIDAISFTGSQAVGGRIAQQCATHLKKVQLEMGGKNPQVVLDDADLAQAVELCVQSAFFSTGQRCTASSRLIVTDGIYSKFIAAMQTRMAALKVGDALAAGIDIGPVSSQAQLAQDFDYVAIGQKEGATLVSGGERLNRDTEGFYMAPALFTDTTMEMRINREEVFGPVASVIRVKDYDGALAQANNTPFGLSAGIATTSLKYATHFKRHSQAGMVMVNLPTAGVDYHVPFGGRKGSSYGSREQGRYAQEFFTTVKTAYTLA